MSEQRQDLTRLTTPWDDPQTAAALTKRWRAAVSELVAVQRECDERPQTLPESLQESSTAEALQAICDLDLDELQEIEPPYGLGRD
jgi:hypothetical protein